MGQTIYQVDRNIAGRKNTRASGSESKKIGAASAVDIQESIENCCHQYCSAIVRLSRILVVCRCRLCWFPFSVFNSADCIAERAVSSYAVTKLLGQLSQQTLLRKIASGLCNLIAQCFGDGEMLEECNDISERFVKSEHVTIRWFTETAMKSI
jgi:hypothetical protein